MNYPLWPPRALSCSRCSCLALIAVVMGIVILAPGTSAAAQSAERLSQVKNVYLEDSSRENRASRLRERLIERLRQKAKLDVVSSANAADAVIKMDASIWRTGYLSTDPRSPANLRQAQYRGFLSVEVVGKNNEPLWSYLVTPSRFRGGDIASNLADQLVTRLISALSESEGAQAMPSAESAGNVVLTAAGATFPAPLYRKWFETFEEDHPNVRIKYDAIGSGAGIEGLAAGRSDFAASDMPLSDVQMAKSKERFLHFASVIGAVVPAYNLPDVNQSLNFTPQVLAGIYLGKIRKWNDPAIQEINHDVALPDTDIILFHRSDASGTTFVWTDYLSKVSPEWKSRVGSGTVVHWPVGAGEEGNEGVATTVQETPNSIGYVEWVYALRHQLNFGAVRNAAGRFVQADLPSVTAAGVAAPPAARSDSRVSITNAAGREAYPIASFTYWLVPNARDDTSKRAALAELLQWVLTSGQKDCSALGYVPLPREVAEGELNLLNALQ